MGGRLLQGFEQGVESPCREHMYLVHDVDAVFGGGGGVVYLVPQIPDAVHAVVGGGVDLRDIGDGARVDPAADFTVVAGFPVHRMQAIDRFGQNFGAGGLARPPGAGEQIRVGQTAGFQLVFEGGGDMGLPVNLVKGLRTPFPVKHLIHGRPPFGRKSGRRKKRLTLSGIQTDRFPAAHGYKPLNAARFPA